MYVQIPGHPMYLVDEYGILVSVWFGKWRVLNPGLNNGYPRVLLCTDGRRTNKCIHTLVAEVFLGPKINGMEVNHIDGNKLNNHLSNLEYVTKKENLQHAHTTGLIDNDGEKHGSAKLTDEQAAQLLSLKGVIPQHEAATQFGICKSQVGNIWRGESRKHLQEDKRVLR